MSKRKFSTPDAPVPADADIRRVLDSLRRVVRVLRLASREAEKRYGLSAAQLFVLQKLAESNGLSVNQVAERTHTHQSSVSMVVQRLVDRGFVSRQRSRKDARQMQLSVTRQGLTVLRTAPAAAQDRLIEALQLMSSARVRQLAENLQNMLELLGIDGTEPAAMLFEDDADLSKSQAKQTTNHGNSKRKAHVDGRTRKRS